MMELSYENENHLVAIKGKVKSITTLFSPSYPILPAVKRNKVHCEKGVRVRTYSGPYFPALGLNTERSLRLE